MKKFLIVAGTVLPALALVGVLAVQGSESAPVAPAARNLPATLAGFYPPQAPAPVYLIEMIGLSSPLSSMMSDFFEGDHENAVANYEAFRAQYAKVAAMVPEWQNEYPMGPVDELGKAIRSGDPGAVMQASEGVGRVCHGCHVSALVPAQQKFHWGDFSAIAVTDPVMGKEASFAQFMHSLDADLNGIGNDLRQGQMENAMEHARGLASRYETLKETCGVCHESERAYFVDENVMKMIGEIPSAMSDPSGSGEALGKLLQGIGQESCHKCHLVHIPAAYARAIH